MPDWLIAYLGSWQATLLPALAAELRAGGLATAVLAFALGAVHALTPGHGKTALAAYFLGNNAHVGKGIRIALTASLLHVLSGFAAFLALRFVLGQAPAITGRGPPAITVFAYSLIMLAGALLVFQSYRPARAGDGASHALTGGIGLLPCPLTISVLGFAWLQSTTIMVGVVLAALSLGIATTIGIVAVVTILVRHRLGQALAERLPQLERGVRSLQAVAGVIIILIALATMWRALG